MITDAELRQMEAMKVRLADTRLAYDTAMAQVDEIVSQEGGEAGRLSGYACRFNQVDLRGDIIKPDAFSATLASWADRGKLPSMCMEHGNYVPDAEFRELGAIKGGNDSFCDPLRNLPFGAWTLMRQDSTGLWVEGRLFALDTVLIRTARILLESGKCRLSVGGIFYRSPANRAECTEVLLREVSLTLCPAEPETHVRWEPAEQIKAA